MDAHLVQVKTQVETSTFFTLHWEQQLCWEHWPS
jgi:hypothetical protein